MASDRTEDTALLSGSEDDDDGDGSGSEDEMIRAASTIGSFGSESKNVGPYYSPLLPMWVPKWLHDPRADHFNMMVGLVIVTNAIIIGIETDLGQPHFMFFEHFFCIFFIGEMFLRIHQGSVLTGTCMGGVCMYFRDGSNCFDGTLVITGTLDLYLLPLLIHGKKGGAVSTLRLLRMLRVLRILRLFKVFHELSVILAAFLRAFSAVMWVSVLTLILDYVCAVFLTKVVGHKAEMYGEAAPKIATWWGSIGNSMRSLFIIMTLAEFDVMMITMQQHVEPLLVALFMVAYVMIAGFTMVSLITGILCEALTAAQSEDEAFKLAEQEAEKTSFNNDLMEMLNSIDSNQDGYLNRKKVDKVFFSKETTFLMKLASVNIDVTKQDLETVVDTVHNTSKRQLAKEQGVPLAQVHDAGVDIKMLVDAMGHMKGPASSSTVQDLRHSVKTMIADHQKTMDTLKDMQTTMDAWLQKG